MPNAVVHPLSQYIPQERFTEASYIDLENKHIGFTGYIDRVDTKMFDEGTSIIYGKDPFNRYYMSVKYEKYDVKSEQKTNHVMTLFQRYTTDETYFASAGDTITGTIDTMRVDNPIEAEGITMFMDMLKNGSVNYAYDDILGNEHSYVCKI
jgi:hypothetical protein